EVTRTARDLGLQPFLPVTVELISTIRERLRGKPVNACKGVTGRGQDARGLGRRPSIGFHPGAHPARRAAVQFILPITLGGSRRSASVCADMRADP
ncbi:MAG TPA: hypothetical protein VFZ03_12190, partial [Dongiaceae bacterium]